MNDTLRLVSPIPTSVNHYLAYRCVYQHGKPTAMSYCTNDAKKYKKSFANYVKSEVVKQGWDLCPNYSQHFYVDVVYYFPRLDLDPNNYLKILFDAITETQLIWLDDNVACERVQAVYYDSKNPRIELAIHPVDYIGVFENRDALNSFELRCKHCARYSRNCGLLHKAIEGRIQEEIANGTCAKYKEIKDNGKNKKHN